MHNKFHSNFDMNTVLGQMSSGEDEAWRAKEITDVHDLEDLHANGVRFRDGLHNFSEELSEYRHGKQEQPEGALHEAMYDMLQDTRLMYFPWRREVVRYPGQQQLLDLRTARNRNLVTQEEQQVLYESVRPAVFGLSVGSNIVDRLTQSGIGDAYLLGDYDRVGVTNLNRIQANMADIGLKKTVVSGRKMSLIDPYIEQTHLETGYVMGETDNILREWKPTVIIDEVDNLAIKAMLRRAASELEVPLVMVGDIGENVIVDVERYDLDKNYVPFHGKVRSELIDKMLADEELDANERTEILIAINGIENLSTRLIESVGDQSLSGSVPQLGSTAARGASLAERVIRSIALNKEELPSNSYVDNPDVTFGIKNT